MARLKSASALLLLCLGSQAQAAMVRYDFTLTGYYAQSSAAGKEVPGFNGTSASGYVILDTSNAQESVDTPTTFVRTSTTGCREHYDGNCTQEQIIAPPVLLDWSFTSLLGTVERLDDSVLSRSSTARSHIPYDPDRGYAIWTFDLWDEQTRTNYLRYGGTEGLYSGFGFSLHSFSAPLFDLLNDMGDAPRVYGGAESRMYVIQQYYSHGTDLSDFSSTGYAQLLSIEAIRVTRLSVYEPSTIPLMLLGLLGSAAVRRSTGKRRTAVA